MSLSTVFCECLFIFHVTLSPPSRTSTPVPLQLARPLKATPTPSTLQAWEEGDSLLPVTMAPILRGFPLGDSFLRLALVGEFPTTQQ